jgi:hypothetical protein
MHVHFGLLPKTDLQSSMDCHPSGDNSHKSTFLVMKKYSIRFLSLITQGKVEGI